MKNTSNLFAALVQKHTPADSSLTLAMRSRVTWKGTTEDRTSLIFDGVGVRVVIRVICHTTPSGRLASHHPVSVEVMTCPGFNHQSCTYYRGKTEHSNHDFHDQPSMAELVKATRQTLENMIQRGPERQGYTDYIAASKKMLSAA